MYFNQVFISASVAEKIKQVLKSKGCPTENRILILSPKDQEIKQGNIIIPGQVKDGIPRKGVVIQAGEITEEYRTFNDLVKPGRVITYGLYAGKEIEFPKEAFPIELRPEFEQQKFTVLSLTEIAYSENNPNN